MSSKNTALSHHPDSLPLSAPPEPLPGSGKWLPGMRFFRNGHWWEIDGYIKGRASSYYRCKPACFVESRFYTESEIQQALDEESKTMSQKPQEYGSRGTGRILVEPQQSTVLVANSFARKHSASKPKARPSSGRKEPLKVLLVGSRQAVKQTIQSLHLAGFASLSEWSDFQNRSNGKEVLSILIQKV